MESSSKEKEEKKRDTLVITGVIFLVLAAVFLIWFFLQGQTMIMGDFPEPEVSTSLTCTSNTYSYPFFVYDNSLGRELTVNSVYGDDKLKYISLTYSLKYNSSEAIYESEAQNHAEMNILFSNDRLEADAFGAKYSRMSGEMQFSIFANADTINTNVGRKYFLLEGAGQGPYSLKTVESLYKQKGLKCEQKS